MRSWRERVCRTAPVPRWLAHLIDTIILAALALLVVHSVSQGAGPRRMQMARVAEAVKGGTLPAARIGAALRQRFGRRAEWPQWAPLEVTGSAREALARSAVLSKTAESLSFGSTWPVEALRRAAGNGSVSATPASTTRANAVGAIVLGVLLVALFVLYLIGFFGVLRKCGYPGWYAVMPFTGPLALCEAGGNVWLWVVAKLLTYPPLSTVADVFIFYGLSVSFVGKRSGGAGAEGWSAAPSEKSIWDDFSWSAFWLTVGFLFVPFLAFPLVAFHDGMQYDARYRARLAERMGSGGAAEYEPIA
ncbi:hypothetical protein CDCA_CDCA14G3870 [Cyanidium caldarium]|uniref:Uncharacterized protein n=1 Tax=Cyanidium caldarium TaxID=2771 RepID=A0AAV9IZT7_CYACA|nr:hypothetical protein CDCA_CDCA14G3870 [Cyanidium caldarium]